MTKSRFRTPNPDERRRTTTDGILGAPVRRVPNASALHANGGFLRPANAPVQPMRRVGGFNQTEGYHAEKTSMASSVPTFNAGAFSSSLSQTSAKASKRRGEKRRRFSWRATRTWAKRGALAFVALVLVGGGFIALKGYMDLHKAFKGTSKTPIALQSHVNVSDLKTEGDSRINILLLGIGGADHEGPDLTDTMLIASIDPVNHTAALVSIPRDLWVAIPHHGSMKINAAYETGKYAYLGEETASSANTKAVEAGFASADSIVSQVAGINIQYNVLVDFQAFEQAVNTVGGVTINVPTELYDPTMAWENGGSSVLARPGVQTFNGLHALFYVRSRETTSDFARTQRQRAVIVAIMQKVFTLGTLSNPLKITQLMDTFGNNVVTDVALGDMSKLYGVVKGINLSAVQSIGLADPPNNYVTTGHIGTQSVVLPRAGLNNYAAIQTYIHSVLPDGYILKEHAKLDVLNGTNNATLLPQEVALLKSYGYDIVASGTAPTQNYGKTMLVDLTKGKDPYTANYLQNRFHIAITSSLPSGVTANGANFVLILGQD